jgi:hypothetical protein
MATTMHCAPYFSDASRVGHGGRVEADLVGPGIEQAPNVVNAAHAAAHGEGDEHLRGHGLDHVQDQVAAVGGGGDVQEGQFVGALLVVAGSDLDRVARVAQGHEVHAFDDPAASDVEAGNDAFGEHAAVQAPFKSWSARCCAAVKSSAPV